MGRTPPKAPPGSEAGAPRPLALAAELERILPPDAFALARPDLERAAELCELEAAQWSRDPRVLTAPVPGVSTTPALLLEDLAMTRAVLESWMQRFSGDEEMASALADLRLSEHVRAGTFAFVADFYGLRRLTPAERARA